MPAALMDEPPLITTQGTKKWYTYSTLFSDRPFRGVLKNIGKLATTAGCSQSSPQKYRVLFRRAGAGVGDYPERLGPTPEQPSQWLQAVIIITFIQSIYNYVTETMFLRYIVLPLFCSYNLCYMYCHLATWEFCILTLVVAPYNLLFLP
jgi:hypothetical protein